MLYENTRVFTINPSCPWYDMQQTFGPPNVNWCEETICALINEPANTYSNLMFIFAALYIVKISKNFSSGAIRNFGWCIFGMGFFSFVYHATNNMLTQFLDFTGMAFYTVIIISINLKRLSIAKKILPSFIILNVVNNLIFPMFLHLNWPIQIIVMLNTLAILITEVILIVKKDTRFNKYFYISLTLMAIAQAFSLADLHRVWCDKENLILHGHAIWHVISGISTFFAYLHYKQFDKKLC